MDLCPFHVYLHNKCGVSEVCRANPDFEFTRRTKSRFYWFLSFNHGTGNLSDFIVNRLIVSCLL